MEPVSMTLSDLDPDLKVYIEKHRYNINCRYLLNLQYNALLTLDPSAIAGPLVNITCHWTNEQMERRTKYCQVVISPTIITSSDRPICWVLTVMLDLRQTNANGSKSFCVQVCWLSPAEARIYPYMYVVTVDAVIAVTAAARKLCLAHLSQHYRPITQCRCYIRSIDETFACVTARYSVIWSCIGYIPCVFFLLARVYAYFNDFCCKNRLSSISLSA